MTPLEAFPRQVLGHFPTPLEPMVNLTAKLRVSQPNVPTLWIKRDDSTGLATGGNKTRKLEFLVGEAVRQGADTLITQGATQSNHARQTAAAAAKAGMGCNILIEQRHVGDQEYELSGNVLLNDLLGAKIERFPAGTDMLAAMAATAGRLREEGRRPFIIPLGGSNAIGALGYVACVEELKAAPVHIDWIVHATASAGTQAGLIAGLHHSGSPASVLGISVRHSEEKQRSAVYELAKQTASLLGYPNTVPQTAVLVDDRWIGAGYGSPTDAMTSALRLAAATEGIILDPVYSGKAFAGLLGNIAEGKFRDDQNIVFLHTGGTPALFAYRPALAEHASNQQSPPHRMSEP